MATLLPLAEQQFLDADAEPLVGGLVYFYVPGTTQPKDTYQDPAGQILNPNPVVLDGAGRAVIYGVGVYRQVVKDADLNVIWDQTTADTASSAASWAGTAGGTPNNIVLAATNFASVDGQSIDFLAAYTNTGASQAIVNGVAIPLKLDTLGGPVQTPGGCIVAGDRYRLTYDGTAGLLHLTPLVDRGYVDAGDAATLASANSATASQVAAGLASADAYAASVAAQAQAAAISTAAGDATAKANAAQSAAQAYAAQGDAATLQSANATAASLSNNAFTAANGHADAGDAQTLASANSNAQGYASTAQAQAKSYTDGTAASTLSQAKTYTDGSVSAAQTSNASTYSRAVRLSGTYNASNAGRQAGSVCVAVGSSSGSNYAFLQYLLNGQWVTAADA